MRNISILHFKFWSQFKPDSRKTWFDGRPRYIIDQDTQDIYSNEPNSIVRIKCFFLLLGSPFVHTIAAIVTSCSRLMNLLNDIRLSIYARLIGQSDSRALLQDSLLLILNLMAPLMLSFAALYGVLLPQNGRKLYASIERLLYAGPVLATCFQPYASRNFLGGDINSRYAI